MWPRGEPLCRVHSAVHRPDSFNATGSVSRFRPFRSGTRVVATAYAAETLPAAISESVFHDIPAELEDQIVLRSELYGYVRSMVVPRRDLALISLRGAGLRRLRTTAKSLIHTEPAEYPATAAYAGALYGWKGRADGLIWDSRLHPGSAAVMLFGSRTRRQVLDFSYDSIEPLWKGTGLEEVQMAAEDAGITIVM